MTVDHSQFYADVTVTWRVKESQRMIFFQGNSSSHVGPDWSRAKWQSARRGSRYVAIRNPGWGGNPDSLANASGMAIAAVLEHETLFEGTFEFGCQLELGGDFVASHQNIPCHAQPIYQPPERTARLCGTEPRSENSR